MTDACAPPIGDRKLRLLCLHGYMQDAAIFRSRLGSMRKGLKSRAEFFFLDAPFPATPAAAADQQANDAVEGSQGRSWWQWTDLDPGTRPSRAAHYSGWEVSQAAITAALQEHAPIDAILGFSQGATAAALYLAHTEPQPAEQEEGLNGSTQQQQQHTWQQRQDQLRAAIIIAGFLPRDESYAATVRSRGPSLPCLHVSGAKDTLVPPDRTSELRQCFSQHSTRVYTHPGAHMVPTCSGTSRRCFWEC